VCGVGAACAGPAQTSVCSDTSVPFGPCSAERSGAVAGSTTCPYYIWERQGTSGSGVTCDSSNSCTTFASAAASNDFKPPFLADTDSNSPNRYGRGENALLRVRGPATVHILELGPQKENKDYAMKHDHLYVRLHGGRGGTKGEMLHGCDESITHCTRSTGSDWYSTGTT
jgi:hypothetical protein